METHGDSDGFLAFHRDPFGKFPELRFLLIIPLHVYVYITFLLCISTRGERNGAESRDKIHE